MIDNVFASLALVAITVGRGPVFDDLKFANSFWNCFCCAVLARKYCFE